MQSVGEDDQCTAGQQSGCRIYGKPISGRTTVPTVTKCLQYWYRYPNRVSHWVQ